MNFALQVNAGTLHTGFTLSGDAGADKINASLTGALTLSDKLYFDGGTHTYIHESSDDVLKIVVGSDDMLTIDESSNQTTFQGAIQVGTNAKLNTGRALIMDADNDGHTYIHEFADNVMKLAAGGTDMLTLDEPNSLATFSNAVLAPTGFFLNSARKVTFDNNTDSHTYIEEQTNDLLNFAVGGENLMAISEKATTSVAQSSSIYTACPVYLKDIGGTSDTPPSGYGSLYVNSDVLYFKTDGGAETNLLSGGGGAKHYMEWYYVSANLASQNTFYSEIHHDEWGVSSSINTDLSSSGYSTTTLNNAWRMYRDARRVPYTGTITQFTAFVESTGAAADSDVEVALWWADALADDPQHSSTVNFTCDHICTLTFDFDTATRWMTKKTTSFNATAITEHDWLFVTVRKTTSGDGSSFNIHSTLTWDGA